MLVWGLGGVNDPHGMKGLGRVAEVFLETTVESHGSNITEALFLVDRFRRLCMLSKKSGTSIWRSKRV